MHFTPTIHINYAAIYRRLFNIHKYYNIYTRVVWSGRIPTIQALTIIPPLLTAKTLSEENPPHKQLTNPVERIHTGHQYRTALADLITDCRNTPATLKTRYLLTLWCGGGTTRSWHNPPLKPKLWFCAKFKENDLYHTTPSAKIYYTIKSKNIEKYRTVWYKQTIYKTELSQSAVSNPCTRLR